jgi:hypothetical protein
MRWFLSAVLAICITASVSWSCCMVPKTYKGTISQNAHEAVIIHHDGRQEMVMRIDYKITGKSMPASFAWVITVPKEPDAYALADEKLFENMFVLSQRLLAPKRPSKGRSKSVDAKPTAKLDGVELGKRVQVGPYDIQPVRGVGPNALTGLNTWLKGNGYPTEDPAHMKYFVQNGFTFLAVKIAPPKGQKTVGSGGKVSPLHLSFATPKPYYPLRFSSRQGVFDVNLHVLTGKKLDYAVSAPVLKQINWWNSNFERNYQLKSKQMPETLKKVFVKSKFKGKQIEWFYNNLRGRRVNQNNAIAKWKTDIFFNGVPKLKQADATAPGAPGLVPVRGGQALVIDR